jgi:hypothetical protein
MRRNGYWLGGLEASIGILESSDVYNSNSSKFSMMTDSFTIVAGGEPSITNGA